MNMKLILVCICLEACVYVCVACVHACVFERMHVWMIQTQKQKSLNLSFNAFHHCTICFQACKMTGCTLVQKQWTDGVIKK